MGGFTFTATGDSLISRRSPQGCPKLQELAALIGQGEARFTNLETTLRSEKSVPGAVSGGTWALSPPEVLEDLQAYGFNLFSCANNHALDYLYGGLETTCDELRRRNLRFAGIGGNLAEAAAPVYLDCPAGRVALVAATTSFPETWRAGEQRRDMTGRPGVNPLTVDTRYELTAGQLARLQALAGELGINAYGDMMRRDGFMPREDGVFYFGSYRFTEGSRCGERSAISPKDARRVLDSIREARKLADYVLFSIHSHQMQGAVREPVPEFLREFCREAVEAGACAVLGHGPHVLRGMEVYRGAPIFYSLGDFIFQSDTVAVQPHDFYEKYGLTHEHDVAQVYDARSGHGSRGLYTIPELFQSVVAVCTLENGRFAGARLHPVDLGFSLPVSRKGTPALSTAEQGLPVLSQMTSLSEALGTTVLIRQGVGIIEG